MNSAGRSCALCATLFQVGRDEHSKSQQHVGTKQHGLICAAQTLLLLGFSTQQTELRLLWPLASLRSLPRRLLQPFCRVHMLKLIKRVKEKTDTFFSPALPAVLHSLLHLLFCLPVSANKISREQALAVSMQSFGSFPSPVYMSCYLFI